MIDKHKMFRATSILFTYLILLFISSCGHPKSSNEIINNNNSNTINHDSLISEVFKYGKPYLDLKSIDEIIALNGNPRNIYKTQWGISEDSLTTFKYPYLTFKFFEHADSKIEFESFSVIGNNTIIEKILAIGTATRQDIIQNLGLPDMDHNDPGRSINKSGDTTVYGTQSGSGDTVTFTYYISNNIDEYAINLAMTKDTLRRIAWWKNPY